MLDWWSSIGEASSVAGSAIGLIWAIVSTARRKRKYIRAAMPAFGQLRWFVLNFVGMGCFVTSAAALGLASLYDLIPQGLFWFLLGSTGAAFSTALLFPSMETPLPSTFERASEGPPADPPILPIRKSA